MCKIAVLTNMSEIKSPKKVINVIAGHMAELEGDGFGYSIQGKDGVFGERTVNPDTFKTSFDKELLNLPFLEATYNRFGKYSQPIGAGIFHGRTSTNDKTLLNTHPINKHDWSLIHNGVVTNEGPAYQMDTTNDTEHLVHYMANGGIDALAANLTGYYASAAFSPDGTLHVFRDNRASLFWARIESIDSYIIATTVDLLDDICKSLKWKASIPSAFKANTYVTLKDNKIISNRSFSSRGATERENRWANKSLGEIQDWSNSKLFDYSAKETEEPQYGDFSEDENAFFEQIQFMDHTWTVLDHRENPLSIDEFLDLDPEDQLDCIVIKPEGTILDPLDADSESLYQGRIA
jgi:hypothetical protein